MPYKNKSKKKQRDKEYREENRDVLRTKDHDRYHLGGKKQALESRAKTDHAGYLLLKTRAKRYGREVLVTFDEYTTLVAEKLCAYCGTSLTEVGGYKLDRLDNSKDYEISNLVCCCKKCNLAKGLLERWGYKYPEIVQMVLRLRSGTHCIVGHEMTKENTAKSGGCLICTRRRCREATRRYRQRKHTD